MNKRIGIAASAINIAAVLTFAISMLIGSNYLSYFSSMFIAFSFVAMMSTFAVYSVKERKTAAICSVGFAAMYATIIVLVYFAQLTTVTNEALTEQADKLLNFQKFGLMFNYDLLGYGLMALSTFFAGLSFKAENKTDKWLKALLLIHGVFFPPCVIMPMLNIFNTTEESSNGGTIALLFWCVYFIPIGILSVLHFRKKEH